MAWKNLRSEIGEIFAEYSRGEDLSEFVQQLWAERLANAKSSHYLALKAWRERNRAKVRAWVNAGSHRRKLREWEQEEERWCAHCRRPYKRPFVSGPSCYCSPECRAEGRRVALAQHSARYYVAHKETISERKKRWYQKNKERVRARQEQRAAEETARARERNEAWTMRQHKRAATKETRNAQSRAHHEKKRTP